MDELDSAGLALHAACCNVYNVAHAYLLPRGILCGSIDFVRFATPLFHVVLQRDASPAFHTRLNEDDDMATPWQHFFIHTKEV